MDPPRAILTCVLRWFFNIAVLLLKTPKMGPRRLHGRPKSAPRGPKRAPRAPKRAPRGPKTAPRGPQEGPRRPQEGSKTSPRGPKLSASTCYRGSSNNTTTLVAKGLSAICPGIACPKAGLNKLFFGPAALTSLASLALRGPSLQSSNASVAREACVLQKAKNEHPQPCPHLGNVLGGPGPFEEPSWGHPGASWGDLGRVVE